MSESNTTHADQTHRIFISSPKPIADRTGLYILILLSFLLFILIFYLVYNFISFKRYSAARKTTHVNFYSTNPVPTETKLLSTHQNVKQSSSSDQYPITSQLVSDL